MLTVGTFEAKAKISELLDKVATGETILITRRGEAAALLVPPGKAKLSKTKGLAEIKRFRKACKTGPVDVEALIAAGQP